MAAFLVASASLVAVGLGPLTLADGSRTGDRRARCLERGATLAASDSARLSKVDLGGNLLYYVCATRTYRRTFIGGYSPIGCGVKPLALAGNFVAYFDHGCSRVPTPGRIVLRDVVKLQTRVLSQRFFIVSDLMVTSRGTVVWIRDGTVTVESPSVRRVQVRALVARGSRLIAEGLDIEPRSLALSSDGRRVYWTQGGTPRSAALTD